MRCSAYLCECLPTYLDISTYMVFTQKEDGVRLLTKEA